MIKYIKVNHPNVTHLRCEVYYNKGGENPFNGSSETRGYYISVSPVKRERGLESYTAWSGKKKCILPVSRQSKRMASNAEYEFQNHLMDYIKAWFPGTEIKEGE